MFSSYDKFNKFYGIFQKIGKNLSDGIYIGFYHADISFKFYVNIDLFCTDFVFKINQCPPDYFIDIKYCKIKGFGPVL